MLFSWLLGSYKLLIYLKSNKAIETIVAIEKSQTGLSQFVEPKCSTDFVNHAYSPQSVIQAFYHLLTSTPKKSI